MTASAAVLAFDPFGYQIPTVGIVVLAVIAAGVGAAHLMRQRREPAVVPELAGVAVAAQRLTKVTAGGLRVIDDVSFQLHPGRVVGLLGPNGAGKTTLLGLITGLVEPTDGQVWVFGHPVAPGVPVLSRVGIAIEEPGLIPHLTGVQLLQTTWAVTGRPAGDAHFDTVSDLSGLGEALHRKVCGYSLGMRQRLALAQAMLGLPDLLLLDEPANGLDPVQVRQLRGTLRDYAASGRTVVLSSHVLTEVEKICDDILVLSRGRLALAATMDDIPRPTVLRLDFGSPDDADAARAALGKHDIESRRTGDTSIEAIVRPDASIMTVLRALSDDGCEVLRLDSGSAFEDAYYAAVADG